MEVKKAILPVAGLGTRVMPLTLHQPKGMIGIVDRPIIHYVIDEIVAAGINHIILVTGPNQPEFKKYITHLEKDPSWKTLGIKFDFVIQEKLAGNGDAVYLARQFIKNEPFLVCFGDDLLADKIPPLKNLVDQFKKANAPIVVVESVPPELASSYGMVKVAPDGQYEDLRLIEDIVEKPAQGQAPSNLAIIGRYLLTPEIFEELEKLYPYTGKEIPLADALRSYVSKGGSIYAWEFPGKRFDAGSKIGILKAQVYFGLKHKDFGPEFREYLKSPGGEGENSD
ncbi:MAG: UTP--glucose-1-phosphate uridylyltransferase [bacterium]|nr:UTP--glucose-1-phosphate uridylyltransferase [bacterium]